MSKRLTDALASVEPLTQQGPVRTWRLRDQIVKCVPVTADVMEAQLPVLDGVQPWASFERLTRTERERLGLPVEHEWVMACRDYIDGSPLEGARDIDPALTCLKLATIVRDLHEVGVVHGDLHPGNVIINDDGLWLIDVALFATTSGVEGHVLGNPSCMAPETWLKQPPTRKSDVYALGCVFAYVFLGRFAHSAASLAQWASAHRNGDVDLAKMPSATAALVRRMLSANPDDRPTLSEILLALEQTYALKSSSAVVVRESHSDAHQLALTPGNLRLVCDDPETRAIFFDEHRLRLQLSGWEVVELVPSPGDGPWTSLLSHLETHGARVRLAGDLANVIERLWAAVQAACAGVEPGLCLMVRELEHHGPDFQQWWGTPVDAPNLLRLSHGGSGTPLPLPGGSQDFWRAWRAQTLRSDVRTIAAPRFDELVEQASGQPGALKLALNRELGYIATSRILDTQTLKAIGPWRTRAQRLLDQCAFGELAALCQTLVESAAKSAGRKQLVDVDHALEFWTTAAIRGARHPDALAALITHLQAQNAQLLLAQLLPRSAGTPRD
ncbi:MAG: lipopolysaccharide core heptose(II) kinase RfaY [bacterium]